MKPMWAVAPLLAALVIACQGQQPLPQSLDRRQLAAPITVDEAVSEALQANPEVRAAVRRLSLAQSKISTARSLDDPMLMVRDWSTPLRQPWDLNQAQVMVGLQRTFIGKEKRDARAQVAGDGADVSASEVEAVRQEIAVQVRKACVDLKRNADEMKLHDRQASLLKEALAGALAEYTTGKVTQAEVLRAQMAVTRLNEHLLELEEERDTAEAQLNALLGRRPEAPVAIAGAYTVPEELPAIESLEQLAIEHRPELASMRKSIARAKDEGQLTRMAVKPDFTVAAGYMLMPSGSYARSGYMAELTVNLPGWNRGRHEGEAKQADAATAVSETELDVRTQGVFLEVRRAQIEVQAAQRRIKLYRDTLLPQAEALFKASTVAYRNNRGEFQAMVESQNLLLDVEEALYKASAAADVGIAELERAIGAPVPSIANAPGRNQ